MHNFKSLEIPFSKASYKSSGRGSLPASSVWVGGIGGLGCESCWCDGDPREWCQAGLGSSPGAVRWALHVPVGAVSPHVPVGAVSPHLHAPQPSGDSLHLHSMLFSFGWQL